MVTSRYTLVFYCPRHAHLAECPRGWAACKPCLLKDGWTADDLALTPFQRMLVMEMADGGHIERWEWEWAEGSHLIPGSDGGVWMVLHPSYDARLKWITVPKRTFTILRDTGWISDVGPKSRGNDVHVWRLTSKAARFIERAQRVRGTAGAQDEPTGTS